MIWICGNQHAFEMYGTTSDALHQKNIGIASSMATKDGISIQKFISTRGNEVPNYVDCRIIQDG